MQPLNPLPRLTRSASLFAAIVFTSSLGFAQQPAPTDTTPDKDKVVQLETFTVSAGFSGSLAAAAEAKQNNQNIVEVIMSEDIGKLPDVSIADSLTRLTGVTTQRTNGRSQAIAIRGLNGDFNTGTLNGIEQVTTGMNRSVEYDQYPAELLNSVVVYKTAAAELGEQGMGGSIDLQTVQPLSKTGRTVALSGYYQTSAYNQLTPGVKSKGDRLNVAYLDQFMDGKLGIALGYAHVDTPYEGKQFQAWGWPTDSSGNYALGGTKSYSRSSELTRDGLMGVLEYKPSSQVHSTINLFYSKFHELQELRGLEIPLAFWSSANLSPGYTVTNGLITNATMTNVQPIIRNDGFDRKDNLTAVSWNLTLGDGTGWTTVLNTGYSGLTRHDQNLETYSGLGFRGGATNPATLTVMSRPGLFPLFTTNTDFSNANNFFLTDPQGWGPTSLPSGGMEGYYKVFSSKDELGEIKLLTKHDLHNLFSAIKIGVNYTDRYKRDGEKPSDFVINSDNGQADKITVPIIGTTDMSWLGLGKVYAYDPYAALAKGVYTLVPNLDTGIVANRFQITEKLTTPFVQLDIKNKLGDVPVTGNIGVQAIHADQSSTGFSATGNTLVPVTGGATYTDFAPSLNLNFDFTDSTILRFSVARQIARPRMFDLSATRTFSYNATFATSTSLNNSPWSGNGGNPALRPWKSNSVDLSLEHYFAKNKGYIAVAGFYKNLLNYIYDAGALADFTGYPFTGATAPVLHQGTITQPVNGTGGKLQGVEFTLSLPSELISPAVKGFGLVVGGAYTDSNIQPWGPANGSAPLAGLSKKVANATLYYENGGFAARISERYNSATYEYITTFGPPSPAGYASPGNGYTISMPEKVVSAQVSYAFRTGQLKNLTFYLQADNLNNEPLITLNNGDPRQVINYQTYGASYSVGASYKF